MYDSVKFTIPISEQWGGFETFEWQDNGTIKNGMGRKWVSRLKNLRLYYLEGYGLTVSGSLPKFLTGTNLESLSLNHIREAFQLIETASGLNVSEGKVTRLDIAFNFSMNHPVSDYLGTMVEMPEPYKEHLVRKKRKFETKCFKCASMKVLFYDKLLESIQNKPKNLNINNLPANLLRYELSFTNVTRYLGGRVEVANLWDETFARKIIDLWESYFQKILMNQPKGKPKIDFNNLSPKGLESLLAALGLQRIGLENLLSCLDEAYPSKRSTAYQRKKKKILALAGFSLPSDEPPPDLIGELKEKIKQTSFAYQQNNFTDENLKKDCAGEKDLCLV